MLLFIGVIQHAWSCFSLIKSFGGLLRFIYLFLAGQLHLNRVTCILMQLFIVNNL